MKGSESLPTQRHGLSIKGKLLTGFAVILGLFSIMLGLVFFNLYQTRQYSEDMVSVYIPIEGYSSDLISAVDELSKTYLSWLLTRDDVYKTQFDATLGRVKTLEQQIDVTRKDTFSDIELEKWNNLKGAIDKYAELESEVENITKQPNVTMDELKKFWKEKVEPQSITIATLVNNANPDTTQVTAGFTDLQATLLTKGISSLVNKNYALQNYVIIMLVFSLVVSFSIVIFTANKITGPLNEAINAAKDIAGGERHAKLIAFSNDETGVLIGALDQMQKSIRDGEETLQVKAKETKELLDNVLVTLAEVKQSVDVQSAGATQQAASINQITASLGEIEKSTTQTVDKARALGKAAKKTQEKGHLGLSSVEESVMGMKAVRDKVQVIAQNILDLSKQTQMVGEITSVVTNLAQQSKMLALNASIEAAKAGESGKGFAVVAAEVKNLAEQSEQSTAQVQQILEDIKRSTEKAVMVTEQGTKEVDQGMKLVEQAGEIIRSLNDVIHDATIASQQIEAAISQEGVGIEQITAGMNEINQVTSSLSEGVKQTTEVIANLSNISMRLKESVDTYKM